MPVAELSQPVGIAAVAGVGLAVVCLLVTAVLSVKLRRLRADQAVILGGNGHEDLASHAADLERSFLGLRDRVDASAEQLEARMAAVEARLDGAVYHRALVRYDAYGEMAGKQSISLALLDAGGNGVVLSSIAHRETARLYCKLVRDGDGEQPLSPEEREAIRLSLAGETRSVSLDLKP